MPRVIEVSDPASITLEECIDGLDAVGFDPRDDARLLEAACWLRKLGNNRTFLGDLLLAELTGTGAQTKVDSAYTPQSIMLSGYRPGYFLRANIWPAASDPVCKASGGGTFAYGMAHDHNFDFLTLGYHGPGYASDYWEYDYDQVQGIPGEQAGLRFTGRRVLTPGTILHYRAHRDVHAQHPPESLSVSINVMATDPVQGWYDQYGFDPASDRITALLGPNSTETFLRLAVACQNENARDFAANIGATHPSDRLRLAAFEARAELDRSPLAQEAVWREGLASGSRLVARAARERLTALG
jgi:hypothetical protein